MKISLVKVWMFVKECVFGSYMFDDCLEEGKEELFSCRLIEYLEGKDVCVSKLMPSAVSSGFDIATDIDVSFDTNTDIDKNNVEKNNEDDNNGNSDGNSSSDSNGNSNNSSRDDIGGRDDEDKGKVSGNVGCDTDIAYSRFGMLINSIQGKEDTAKDKLEIHGGDNGDVGSPFLPLDPTDLDDCAGGRGFSDK